MAKRTRATDKSLIGKILRGEADAETFKETRREDPPDRGGFGRSDEWR